MTITPNILTRWAGLAAVAAGAIFIGVQVNHPYLDATSVTTTEVVLRDSLKVLMSVLALVGITGMYLRQVRQTGVLGLVGYVLYALCYLVILCTSFVAAYVLPSIAGTDTSYVNDVTAEATNRHAVGDIGLLQQAIAVQGVGYLLGGLVFGIALYRARVLPRWAAALLAVGGVASVALVVHARRLLPLPGLPERHRHDRAGLLAVAGHPRRRRTQSTAVDTPLATTAGVE